MKTEDSKANSQNSTDQQVIVGTGVVKPVDTKLGFQLDTVSFDGTANTNPAISARPVKSLFKMKSLKKASIVPVGSLHKPKA